MSGLALLRTVAARCLPGFPSRPLRAARRELRHRLELAFSLADTHARLVRLEPARPATGGQVSLRLPREVHWGRPSSVPLPPGLADSGWRGGRPRPITVMPRRRAAANVWFLHHGREALCLRLDLQGQVELLRYRPFLRTWIAC